MDEGLFRKHILHIQKQKDSKDELISFVKEKTNITLESQEISLSKNVVIIYTSSVKKSKLIQSKLKEFLGEKGYQLKI